MNSLKRSPVDKCKNPYRLIIMSDCVPFPDPGPPKMNTIFGFND